MIKFEKFSHVFVLAVLWWNRRWLSCETLVLPGAGGMIQVRDGIGQVLLSPCFSKECLDSVGRMPVTHFPAATTARAVPKTLSTVWMFMYLSMFSPPIYSRPAWVLGDLPVCFALLAILFQLSDNCFSPPLDFCVGLSYNWDNTVILTAVLWATFCCFLDHQLRSRRNTKSQ